MIGGGFTAYICLWLGLTRPFVFYPLVILGGFIFQISVFRLINKQKMRNEKGCCAVDGECSCHLHD